MTEVLLVYSPINEPRRTALTRIAELFPKLVLLTEYGTVVPEWATRLFAYTQSLQRADLPAAEDAVRVLLDRTGAVPVGIVSLSETGLVFCSDLAAALGLRFTPRQVLEAARDKSKMRAAFHRESVPSVRFSTAADLPEALRAAESLGYPVVLKPLLAGGSLYVCTVRTPEELSAAFDAVLRGGASVVKGDPLVIETFGNGRHPRLLVEELITGERLFASSLDLPVGEISVEGCVVDGEVHVLARHDKPLPANGPFFEEVLWSAPSRVPAEQLSRVDAAAAAAVRALGLRDSMFHAEMRTTSRGPVLIEVAARMGGGPIYRSALLAHGHDLVEVMTQIATGTFVPPVATDGPARAVITVGLFADEGHLREIRGLAEVRAHPGVVEVCIYEHPGTYIHRAPRSDHCTVHVMISAPTFDEAEEVGRWAQEHVEFVTSP